VARPPKCKFISAIPANRCFLPETASGEAVVITLEHLEVLRKVDYEEWDQDEAATFMGISRGTVQRMLQEAHHLVAEALVHGKSIRIEGGNVIVGGSVHHSRGCRHGSQCTKDKGFREDENMEDRNNTVLGIVSDGLRVFPHFGRAPGFHKVEIIDGEIRSQAYVDLEGQGHEAIPTALAKHGVRTLLAGGIGQGALNRLDAEGISVLAGIDGDVQTAIAEYVKGSLQGSDAVCNHHDGDSHHSDSHHSCH